MKRIPSNFKTVILQTVISNGNRDEWNNLFNIAIAETNAAEKLRMLRALTSSRDYERLKL